MNTEKSFEERYEAFTAESESTEVAKPDVAPDTPAQELAGVPAKPESSAAKEAEGLFPGYNQLPDETRAAIDGIIASERAERAAAEEKARRFYNQNLPIQRALTRTEKQLRDLTSAQHAPSPPASKTPAQTEIASRLEKFRSELPDEAAAIEEAIAANMSPVKQKNEELEKTVHALVTELEYEKTVKELNRLDPAWQSKITSEDFEAWRDAVCDESGDYYDPMLAEAIDRAVERDDGKAMRSILIRFNDELARANELEAAQRSAAPTQVRKPTPDPSARKGVQPIVTHRQPVDEFEKRYNDFLARHPD